MALQTLDDNLNIIAALQDEPNDVGGLTPAQLKAKYDEAALTIQTFINNLIGVLNGTIEGSSGAENIGSASISGITGTTVRAQIADLLAKEIQDIATVTALAQAAQAGTILDGSLMDAKLSDEAGEIKDRLAKLVADNLYQTAGGTATALTLTISGTLVDGYPITFIASANNSGAATTVNSKNLYKPGGTDAPTLVAGKAYTIWYSLSGDNFFIKASSEGDAVAADVLAGKYFSNQENEGILGTLDLSNLLAGNIKENVVINGVTGTLKDYTANFSSGSNVVFYCVKDFSLPSGTTTPDKILGIRVKKAGMVTVQFDMKSTNYGRAQIYVNGVAVGSLRSNNTTTYQTYTENITVAVGDTIQIYAYVSSGSNVVYVRNFYIKASEANPIIDNFTISV